MNVVFGTAGIVITSAITESKSGRSMIKKSLALILWSGITFCEDGLVLFVFCLQRHC
jgi:hypothetical protein